MIYIKLFLVFFKIGLFSFGGGYAILSMIEREVITNYNWITLSQFTDIVAISQITPGPIGINAATYIGYSTTQTVLGSFIATLGVITPSIIVMVIIFHFIKIFKESKYVERAFKGLRPTVIGLIFGAGVSLLRGDAFIDYKSYLIFIVAFISALKFRVGVIKIIVISGILGALFYN